MKLYRGICNILFKDIDPYFKGSGEYNSFGEGTSYAINRETAKIYAEGVLSNDIFGFLIEYNSSNTNKYEVLPNNFLPQDDSDFDEDGFYLLEIEKKEIRSNKLSEIIKNLGYNSVEINESDQISTGQQLLVLDDSVKLELESIHFIVDADLVELSYEEFKNIGLKKIEENSYEVPFSKIKELDEFISEFLI